MQVPLVPPPCPKCGDGSDVTYTAETLTGSYCRCSVCGHLWHIDLLQLKTAAHSDQLASPKKK